MSKSRQVVFSFAAICAAGMFPLMAQGVDAGQPAFPGGAVSATVPAAPENAGLGSASVSIHAYSFTPISSSISYTHAGGARYRTGGGDEKWFDAQIALPTGAHIDQVAFEVFENHTSSMAGSISVCSGNPAGSACAQAGVFGVGPGNIGWTYFSINNLDITVDNLNNSYYVEINVGDSTDGSQQFRRAIVYYHLQLSPAPATASFGDVPISHPFFQYIEALKASGITGGCGGGNYCPDNPLTRGQMAVFLSKALGLYWPN